MSETYLSLAAFAQTLGLIYFVAVFLAVLCYALAPSRKAEFDRIARLPLED